MKEFNLNATDIFEGISPKRINDKNKIKLEKCHNLEPVEEDYVVHEEVIDMNTSDFDWGNS